jgi:hypothetical protein
MGISEINERDKLTPYKSGDYEKHGNDLAHLVFRDVGMCFVEYQPPERFASKGVRAIVAEAGDVTQRVHRTPSCHIREARVTRR